MDLSALPKVELHLHLDCSLSYKAVQQLRPGTTPEEYREAFIAPPKCRDLLDFITRADAAIRLMQTEEQLRLVVLDLYEQLQADRVIYAEIRFAPLLHTQKGLSASQVVQAVNDAAAEGMARTGIRGGLILCTLRHFSEEQSMETVLLVEQFRTAHVVGFDIASDEAGYPIDKHVRAFQYAREKGLQVTAHAGEAKGPESVWETLQHFRPSRIGHGVRSAEDHALLEYMKQHAIHLEICPTSNIQTNIYPDMPAHTADLIYRTGVSMGINTDGRTTCHVTLADEYATLVRVFGWEKAHFLKCNLEAIAHAFAPEAVKAEIRDRILQGFA